MKSRVREILVAELSETALPVVFWIAPPVQVAADEQVPPVPRSVNPPGLPRKPRRVHASGHRRHLLIGRDLHGRRDPEYDRQRGLTELGDQDFPYPAFHWRELGPRHKREHSKRHVDDKWSRPHKLLYRELRKRRQRAWIESHERLERRDDRRHNIRWSCGRPRPLDEQQHE